MCTLLKLKRLLLRIRTWFLKLIMKEYNFEEYTIKLVFNEHLGVYHTHLEEFRYSIGLKDIAKNDLMLAQEVLKPYFEIHKKNLLAESKPLPEPGVLDKITYASAENISFYKPFAYEFLEYLFDQQILFISDVTTLDEFLQDCIEEKRQEVIARCKLNYDVDITNYIDRPLYELMELIFNHNKWK